MGKKQRKMPGINSSSMADVSFILLIFFLVTTSMDSNKGLSRRLPPPLEKPDEINVEIKRRNLFVVKVNSMNQLMVQGELLDLKQLRAKAKEFIKNEAEDPSLPEVVRENIEYLGDVSFTKNHVISLQNDVDTQYQTYIEVQNELIAAYNELRNEYAQTRFGRKYDELPVELQKSVQKVYPQKISEAEPKNYGGL